LAGHHVAIVGAGIAGLTLAIALGRIGWRATLIEQAAEAGDAGAGIQLSPNATRILDRLGLTARLASHWHEPPAVRLVSGLTRRPITHLQMGEAARRRWHAPYAVMHRADLQEALLEEARSCQGVRMVTGTRFETASADDARQAIAGLAGEAPDLIVGADGVWSEVRKLVDPGAAAAYSGRSAWRMQVNPTALAGLGSPDAVTAFLAPGAHLVAYPLPARGMVNVVAIADSSDAALRLTDRAGETHLRCQLAQLFARWHPAFARLVDAAELTGRWPIHEMARSCWGGGSIVLIGDAAHAMAPHAAQGAAMAIEDAFVLAECLKDNPEIEVALGAFVARRDGRIDRVRRRAAFNRFAYHARGPVRIARDIVLSLRKPEALAADFDWLYGGERQPDS
jgi:salicylate hydroxylase